MPDEIGVRRADGGHELFIGDGVFRLTDDQLIRFSRLIPTYLRTVVEGKARIDQGLSAILPMPVTDIRLNEDLLATQVHLSIDDMAGGSFDYALEPQRARHLGERLIARAAEVEAIARGQMPH